MLSNVTNGSATPPLPPSEAATGERFSCTVWYGNGGVVTAADTENESVLAQLMREEPDKALKKLTEVLKEKSVDVLLDDINEQGHNALHVAIEKSQSDKYNEIAKELITALKSVSTDQGPALDIEDRRGFTAFLLAVKIGNIEIIKALAEAGASLTVCTKARSNAFYLALNAKQPNKIEILESLIALFESQGLPLEPCLNAAIQDELQMNMNDKLYLHRLQWLIAHVPDLNARQKDDPTLLEYAVEKENSFGVMLLILNGADPAVLYRDGKPLIELAKASGHHGIKKTIEVVITNNIPPGPDRMRAALWHSLARTDNPPKTQEIQESNELEVLSKLETIVKDYPRKASSPSEVSVFKYGFELLDATGNTPLHTAIAKGKVNMALKLLAFGASLEIKNSEGKTPLQMTTDEAVWSDLQDFNERVAPMLEKLKITLPATKEAGGKSHADKKSAKPQSANTGKTKAKPDAGLPPAHGAGVSKAPDKARGTPAHALCKESPPVQSHVDTTTEETGCGWIPVASSKHGKALTPLTSPAKNLSSAATPAAAKESAPKGKIRQAAPASSLPQASLSAADKANTNMPAPLLAQRPSSVTNASLALTGSMLWPTQPGRGDIEFALLWGVKPVHNALDEAWSTAESCIASLGLDN